MHPDPLVGYTLRADADLRILDGRVRSDALGLRARPGPPAPPDAVRIVVLGDSVAFGFGLDDDQTLAARLESLLAESRGPAARPVTCRTVAIPGWNHRNAVHFLLDHLSELDPDVVVYMPIGNDLEDTDGVLEDGRRRKQLPDPANPDPWTWVGSTPETSRFDARDQWERAGAEAYPLAERVGYPALRASLSAESRRRYEANADSIALLAEHMTRRGTRLLLAQFDEGLYDWQLAVRLLERGLDLPVVPLFVTLPPALRLPDDPHPNVEATEAMALWIAADLRQRGWVPRGADGALPEVSAACAAEHARTHPPDELLRIAAAARANALARTRPAFDMRTGEGLTQLYTSLEPDGACGPRLLLALSRAGGRLEVELAPVEGRPDLVPLGVTVEADGVPLGRLDLGADGVARAVWDLPPPADADVVEVRLVPERWVVREGPDGGALVAFRPLRVACLP